MLGIFFKEEKDYTSQLNPVKGYIEQLSYYISKQKNLPIEEAKQKAILFLKSNFKDKPIKYFQREENGDRIVLDSTLLTYIQENIKSQNVMAPTLTSYLNRKVKPSIHSDFVDANVKIRNIAKKKGQQAKAEGKYDLADSLNNEQNNKKTYNNALSGVYGQEACVFYNPTAHNSLTSLTRTITSVSNASNERLLGGNRYLPRSTDVYNSIVYIATYTKVELVKSTIEKYQLHVCTVDEVISVLKYSSDLYFKDELFYQTKVRSFLEKLDPYTLSNIVYSGDFYHIRKFNGNFVRVILSELIKTKGEKVPLADIGVIYKIPEAVLYYAHTLLYSVIKGYGKDYEKMNVDGVANLVYQTSLNIIEVLEKYKEFFRCFFMESLLPNNSFRLGNMNRRVVVLSDTDSTCFTLDEWVKWYKGDFIIDDESIGLGGCMSFIASQAIVNTLATLSSNMNIAREYLFKLAMKNEFLWTVHGPCEVSKHYFAYTVIQEGNVYIKPEIERKGVHIKNSAVPVDVVKDSVNLIEHILSSIHNNQKLKLNDIIKRIIDLENSIIDSVRRGETIYLKKGKIKEKEAYALDEMKSPYQRHVFWENVFSMKYGEVPKPPYDVVKFPTIVKGSSALNNWIESIEDLELKARLIEWLKTYNKKELPTVYLNEEYVKGNGVPKELLDVVKVKQIVFDTTMQHRVILETLGVMLNKELLVNEQFKI